MYAVYQPVSEVCENSKLLQAYIYIYTIGNIIASWTINQVLVNVHWPRCCKNVLILQRNELYTRTCQYCSVMLLHWHVWNITRSLSREVIIHTGLVDCLLTHVHCYTLNTWQIAWCCFRESANNTDFIKFMELKFRVRIVVGKFITITSKKRLSNVYNMWMSSDCRRGIFTICVPASLHRSLLGHTKSNW